MGKSKFVSAGMAAFLLCGGIALAAEAPDYLHWPKPAAAKYAAWVKDSTKGCEP